MHWRGTRRLLERSKRRRRARSSQSLKLAGCIIVIDEPPNVSDPVRSQSYRSNQRRDCRRVPISRCVVAELRAVDVRSSHKLEEDIGAASSENWLFITKMGFSVWIAKDQAGQRYEVHGSGGRRWSSSRRSHNV